MIDASRTIRMDVVADAASGDSVMALAPTMASVATEVSASPDSVGVAETVKVMPAVLDAESPAY